jgi:2-haloalkanoic acid dehalogenase type II
MTRPITDFTTLTFDCYGTLIDWESGIVAALGPWLASNGLSPSENEVLEAFAAAEETHERATPAALYPDILSATMGDMAAAWGVALEAADAAAFAASVGDWPAFPDSAEALAYLKRHYKLVVISNVDRESFARSNARLGVEFDLIVTAQDVGSYKPDLRNFHYALDKLAALGVAKDQVLHTAQSLYHDHAPAAEVGLARMWINRRGDKAGGGATVIPDGAVIPERQVPSMAALVEMHRGLVGS